LNAAQAARAAGLLLSPFLPTRTRVVQRSCLDQVPTT
jgi:hypothetical protein